MVSLLMRGLLHVGRAAQAGAATAACYLLWVSIISTFKKLVDPINAQQEEEERRRAREEPKREHAGDPPRFACRVCGHVDVDRSYCSECLADTMEPLPK